MLMTLCREGKLGLRKRISREFLGKFVGSGSLFIVATIIANFLVYGDRWLLAEYGISKSDIAVYSVAVQASVLVIALIEQISQFVLPYVSNIKSYDEITASQARKIIQVTLFSVACIIVFGTLGGLLYMKMFYGSAFLSQGKGLFIIILGGVVFYPFQMFSRALVVRFHSLWSIILIYAAACVIFFSIVYFLRASLSVYAFAYARQIAYIWISVLFASITQRHLLKKLR